MCAFICIDVQASQVGNSQVEAQFASLTSVCSHFGYNHM